MNEMELCLVHDQKENCHCDHIPFNMKGIGNYRNSFKNKSDVDLLTAYIYISSYKILALYKISPSFGQNSPATFLAGSEKMDLWKKKQILR